MFETFLLGKYFKGDSFLHKLDPRTKIFSVLFFSIVTLFIKNILSLSFLLLVMFFCIIISRINVITFLKNFRIFLVFLVILYCIHIFFDKGDIIFQYSFIKITKQGLYEGVVVVGRIIIFVSFATLLTMTTPIHKLVRAIERLLSFVKIIGINPSNIAFMIGLSIRFIPVFFSKLDNVIKSLKARGVVFNKGTFKERVEKCGLVINLLWNSIDRYADELSISLRLRGFNTRKHRTSCYRFVFGFRDYIVFICLPLFLIFCL